MPDSIMSLLNQAVAAHQSGDLSLAETLYGQVLEQAPQQFDALHLLGVLSGQKRDYPKAFELMKQALQIKPDEPNLYFNLAKLYLEQENYSEAKQALQRVVELTPQHGTAYYLLGQIHLKDRSIDQAIHYFEQTLNYQKDFVNAHNDLGCLLEQRGQFERAVYHFQQAIALKPDYIEAYNNLGNALQNNSQWYVAYQIYQSAIKVCPTFSSTYSNLAALLIKLGKIQEAQQLINHALKLNPNDVHALYTMGRLLLATRHSVPAMAYLEKALTFKPDDLEIRTLMSECLITQGKLNQAIEWTQGTLSNHPNHVQSLLNLSQAFRLQGEVKTAIEYSSQAVTFEPKHQNILLWDLLHDPDLKLAEQFKAYQAWGNYLTQHHPRSYFKYAKDKNPERRLKIGYLSADFKDHSAAFFYPALMQKLDRQAYEVICYSDVLVEDYYTEYLKGFSDQWHSVTGLSHSQVAELIHNHQIDILIDPGMGFTGEHRQPVFSIKPAPLQVAFFPMTTGLESVDYCINDWEIAPLGQERFYTEKLFRLPHCLQCYSPPQNTPAVGPLPSEANGYITFGSFNRPSKMNEAVIQTWAEILNQVPEARLLLKGDFQDEQTCQSFKDKFAAHDIDSERIEFVAHLPERFDHIELYNRVDIILDTFPFCGHTTTYEALWMSVPAITLNQERYASGVSSSALKQLGLAELVAQNRQHYIELAVNLAQDPMKLHYLHSHLRNWMVDSPLCDLESYGEVLSRFFRQIWRKYCKST